MVTQSEIDKIRIMGFGGVLSRSVLETPWILVEENAYARAILSDCIREFADMIDTQKFNSISADKMAAYYRTQCKMIGDCHAGNP